MVIPLEEVLFIVRGDRREEDVMNVFGEYNDIVGGRVGVIGYDLEPKFRVMLCDSRAVGSEEDKDFVE